MSLDFGQESIKGSEIFKTEEQKDWRQSFRFWGHGSGLDTRQQVWI